MRASLCLAAVAFLVSSLASCAGRPKRATCPPPPKAPTAKIARGSVWPNAEGGPSGESLLEHVPDSAVFALVIRRSALAPLLDWLDSAPDMRVELARYLAQNVGVDLTALQGAVLFGTHLGSKPSLALLLRLQQRAQGGQASPLKVPPASVYRGVPLISRGHDVVTASVPAGLLVGRAEAVKRGIDLAQGRASALQDGSLLGEVLRFAGRGVQIVAAVHLPSAPPIAARVQPLGLELGLLTVDARRKLTLRLSGDPSGLQQVLQIARTGIAVGITALERLMQKATQEPDVVRGVGAIISYFQVRNLLHEMEPEIVAGQLVSSYTVPKIEANAGFIAYAGIFAAVGIPAFIKYIRKSRTVEATEGLAKIRAALEQYYAARKKQRRRFRFPKSTDWTPAASCCQGGSSRKCPGGDAGFDHPTWRALQFKLVDPHYYQYRIASTGQGVRAKVEVEARGDLDCDDTFSSFRIVGTVSKQGLEFEGPVIANEIE